MSDLIRKALILAAMLGGMFCAGASPAAAQNHVCPTAPPGTSNNQCASTAFVQSALSGGLPLAQNHIFVGNGSNLATDAAVSGDCLLTFGAPAVLRCPGTSSDTQVLVNSAGTIAGISNAQLTARINAATASLSGALPAWPNNTTTFFRGDGTYQTLNFAAVAGQATLAQLPNIAADSVLGNPSGSGATTLAGMAIPNCTGALTYSTTTHLIGCNAAAGTGTVTGPVSSTDFDVALWNGAGGTALRDASAGFGLMPGGLKVTNTTDISTLSGLQGSTQISGGLSIAKQVLSLATGEPAFQVANCNINALTQQSPFATQENLMFYDCTDTLSIGPNNDNGRTVIQYQNPRQLFKYDEKISFCQASLDARLQQNVLGAGVTQGFSAPCRMTVAPNTGSVNNGATYPMNNFQLNMPARTNIYFILDATDNRNHDIRFGISALSGGDILGQAGCYFMSLQTGVTANTRYVCTDGATTVNNDAGVNNIQTRRIYMLQIVKGTPAGGNPKVNFWCGDSNNVLQACGSINVGTAGLPNDVTNLIPFFRVKENNTTFAYTVNMNEVYVITEQ